MKMRSSGNSIAEYGFVAALVAVALIVVFLQFGGNLKKVTNKFAGEQTSHRNTAILHEAYTDIGNGNGPPQVAITLPNGNTIMINSVLVNATAQTAGANGGEWSDSITQSLLDLAQALEDGGADPALAGLIRDLANEGHDMAGVEKVILTACDSKDCSAAAREQRSDQMYAHYVAFQNKAAAVRDYIQQHPGALPPALENIIGRNNGIIVDIAKGFNPVENFGSTPVDARVEGNAPLSTAFHSNLTCGTQGSYTDCYQ